jgi:hypothetical protein
VTDSAGGATYIGRDHNGVSVNGHHNIVTVGSDPVAVGRQRFADGVRLLKSRLYSAASAAFDEAIQAGVHEPDAYFMSAVATLEGRRPCLCPRRNVQRAESLLDCALNLEDRAVFHYLLAYLRSDFYERKGLRPPVPSRMSLHRAKILGVADAEVLELFQMLNVAEPSWARGG